MMETFGATVHPSPSNLTEAGRAMLAADPDSTGSLGMAISEAVENAAADPNARYALGSVLNHVLLHQTIIGEEALKQFEHAGDTPDLLVGCTGGGSNFGGLAFPFLREKLAGLGWLSSRYRDRQRGSCQNSVDQDHRSARKHTGDWSKP
jgi:tryptophan synthase beta chain